ncbi:sulfurtransferase TusA family protein [bacterium]|nr:sulfurtransferase TusA family protein [bacterium]
MVADIIVDVTGETCPVPLVEMRKAVMKADKGKVIVIRGTHGASREEIPMAVDSLGLKLLKTEETDGVWQIFIER